jgi:hypothetical protein
MKYLPLIMTMLAVREREHVVIAHVVFSAATAIGVSGCSGMTPRGFVGWLTTSTSSGGYLG